MTKLMADAAGVSEVALFRKYGNKAQAGGIAADGNIAYRLAEPCGEPSMSVAKKTFRKRA